MDTHKQIASAESRRYGSVICSACCLPLWRCSVKRLRGRGDRPRGGFLELTLRPARVEEQLLWRWGGQQERYSLSEWLHVVHQSASRHKVEKERAQVRFALRHQKYIRNMPESPSLLPRVFEEWATDSFDEVLRVLIRVQPPLLP